MTTFFQNNALDDWFLHTQTSSKVTSFITASLYYEHNKQDKAVSSDNPSLAFSSEQLVVSAYNTK